jgi:DAHP synthetase I family
MIRPTDDLRIRDVRPLISPAILLEEIPISERVSNIVADTRMTVANILKGHDRRIAVIVGPCSIHDTAAALEYAERLKAVADRYSDHLVILMRAYFEKPRTVVGWKGLINDPDLDESYHINKGLRLARKLLLDINQLGVPTASEFLDTQIPQHIADLTSWVTIESWPPGCRRRSASRTAPTAARRLRWMPYSARDRGTGSRRSPSRASQPSFRPKATTSATSFCAAARAPAPITTRSMSVASAPGWKPKACPVAC